VRKRWIFPLAAAIGGAAACDRPQEFPQPPASEYTAAPVVLAEGTKVDTVRGASVTQEFMRVSGVRALLGRLFYADDFQPAGSSIVFLSEDLWQHRFGGDPRIIGKPLQVNGRNTVVVGVAPKQFSIPAGAQIWLPRREASP
jgi:MacB-like protein